MATGISGIFNSQQFTQDLAVKDFDSFITRLMPNGTAMLFGLTSMLKTETATNTTHGYFSKTLVFPNFVLTANIDNTQTTFAVTTTENLIQGQVYELFQTKEKVIILQVLSQTSVNVQRGVGSTPAAINIASQNPRAYMVGNAYEEASLRPNALAINPIQITNLTQIFRNSYAISGTAAAVATIAGNQDHVSENRQDAAHFHATSIETALIFGTKSQGHRNGQPIRTMDGLISIVGNLAYYPSSYTAPNVYQAGATTNAIQLEDMLDPVFNQTTDPKIANERILFVGGQAARVINRIAMLNGEYKLVDGQTNWGLQFRTLQFARGKFTIIEHPLLNTNPDWAKMAIALDISTFNVAYLAGRKTQDRMFNAQGSTIAVDNGIDAIGGTLTTEMTALIRNAPANAIIYNLTAGAANP